MKTNFTERKGKLQRIPAEELDTAEDITPFQPYKIYYLPTPHNVYGAGKTLVGTLKATQGNDG